MDSNLAKIRRARSQKDFPELTLEDDEYVEFAFTRARVCLLMILGGTAAGLILILLAFLLVILGQSMLDEMGRRFLFIILSALLIAALLVGSSLVMLVDVGPRFYGMPVLGFVGFTISLALGVFTVLRYFIEF